MNNKSFLLQAGNITKHIAAEKGSMVVICTGCVRFVTNVITTVLCYHDSLECLQVRVSVLPTLNEKGDIVGISQPLLLFVEDSILVARGDEAMGAQVLHIMCVHAGLKALKPLTLVCTCNASVSPNTISDGRADIQVRLSLHAIHFLLFYVTRERA